MNQVPQTRPVYASAGWLYAFLFVQFACQVALVAPLGSARMGFRAMTYLSSLAMLVLVPSGGYPYPTRWLVVVLIAFTSIGLVHPNLNTALAGFAQIGLTVAVWCPIFWATRFELPSGALRKTVLLLWGFNALGSAVGVLQVYYPGVFMPDPEFARAFVGMDIEGQKLELANGEIVWRPMGLTDSPGAAAGAGQFAFLAGILLAVTERNVLLKVCQIMGAVAGVFCIYLSQVRTSLVLLGLTIAAFAVISAICKRGERGLLVCALSVAAGLVGFVWAVVVGGTAVTDRLATLTEERADKVYYSNRGRFLEGTIYLVSDYPLGAGLGRWGMMLNYFGDPTKLDSFPLWAEIQTTAWLYDGGVLLIIAGYAAIFACCWVSIQIAWRTHDPQVADWAMLVAALDASLIVNTLTYAVFASQTGMSYLLLNGLVFASAMYCQPKVEHEDWDSNPLP